MPWFKVDDTFHSHPKARKAGLAAIGMWSVAGAYSMNYKTDGFIADWYVLSWPEGRKLAGRLVKAGLWKEAEKDDEVGWQFHDWSHFQPTVQEIEADREFARDRQRKRRERLREARKDGANAA